MGPPRRGPMKRRGFRTIFSTKRYVTIIVFKKSRILFEIIGHVQTETSDNSLYYYSLVSAADQVRVYVRSLVYVTKTKQFSEKQNTRKRPALVRGLRLKRKSDLTPVNLIVIHIRESRSS